MLEVNSLSPVALPRMTGIAPWIRLAREPKIDAVYERSARRVVRRPSDAYEIIRHRLAHEDQEVFVTISIDVQGRVIACSEITRGTADMAPVTARGTFRLAIALGAHAIIIAHNHPGGDPAPSTPDRMMTNLLRDAGRIIGIPVHDHIIVGDDCFFSFSEAGLL